MRVGYGYDAHRLVPGRALILGGVAIPFERGLAAHSDGDVVIHALCDALLGAAALGDIGQHFPDSSPEFENIDSRILLRATEKRIQEQGLSVSNTDVSIVAQAPKVAPFIDAMRTVLSSDLCIEPGRVNIKATTTEGMGFTGRGEGIVAHAVVLLDEA